MESKGQRGFKEAVQASGQGSWANRGSVGGGTGLGAVGGFGG